MSGIHVVYLVLTLIFAIFITYMFVYNIRQNNRQKAFRSGHRPVGDHESSSVAITEEERAHKTGNIS